MLLNKGSHLTYCTNIHPGASWEDHFAQLKQHLPSIRSRVAPDENFGVGLRLAAMAAETLTSPAKLEELKDFLQGNKLYVFTMNGFPYGNFHHDRVKEQVHQPDWRSPERLIYTKRLFTLLQDLVPEGMDGGISTSPLSYMPLFPSEGELNEALETSLYNLIEVVAFLHHALEKKGILMHLDIEPEPDGILENTQQVIHFYNEWLLKKGIPHLEKRLGINSADAEAAIRRHIQLCYDVCHFALVYEEPGESFAVFKSEGIGIGKIQLSSALKTPIRKDNAFGKEELKHFEEDVYLHQVITRDNQGQIKSYSDLPVAFKECPQDFEGEWRVHFHVPLFTEEYGHLSSTQKDVSNTLALVKQENIKAHLEVETYTWDVLPEPLKLDIQGSIVRELEWVKGQMYFREP